MAKSKQEIFLEQLKKQAEKIIEEEDELEPIILIFGNDSQGLMPLKQLPKDIWPTALKKVLDSQKANAYAMVSEAWASSDPKYKDDPENAPQDDREDVVFIAIVEKPNLFGRQKTFGTVGKIRLNQSNKRIVYNWTDSDKNQGGRMVVRW